MAGGSRSRLGCWSCRLRRKKCDERRPECATCEGLGVRCHGYGQRPEWMDGGEKEKTAAADMRRDIKAAARREPLAAQDRSDRSNSNAASSQQSQTPERNLPPEKEFASIVLHDSPIDDGPSELTATQGRSSPKTQFSTDSAFSRLSQKDNLNGLDGQIATSVNPKPVDFALPQALKGREASLLMYYFDYIFPLQFRMYRPTATEGGRGWLLTLLLRTPPIYHMTLALSAHCYETMEVPNGARERKRASFAFLGSAMQNLQQYIRVYTQEKEPQCLEDSIKVFGCILQMIAFIGFTGGIDNWQIHMNGASEFVPRFVEVLVSSTTFLDVGASPQSSISAHGLEGASLSNEDEVTLKFLITVYLWIDITGCLAFGSSPFLAEQHERLLGGPNPPLQLDKVMGVQNWGMILIGQIAILDVWKRASQSNGTLSVIELVKKATKLEIELKQALVQFAHARKQTTPNSVGLPKLTPLSDYSDYVTELYGSAALTYLHVIVSGPHPELPEIRENVCITMELLRRLPNPFLPRCTLWPLLITGSMVMPDEQSFIRNLFIHAEISDTSLGTGYNILRTLEGCWTRRRNNDPIVPLGAGYWGDLMSSLHLKVMVL